MKKANFQILCSVIICHIALLGVLYARTSSTHLLKTQKKALVVNTRSPLPKKTSAPIKKTAPAKKTPPPPKKTASKPAPSKPVAKKPPPAKVIKKKETSPPPVSTEHKELLKSLQESLAKLEEKAAPSNLKKLDPLPTVPTITSSEAVSAPEKSLSYEQEISHFLHKELLLPEYGEVKIKIQTGVDGAVISVKVLHSESESNRRYLEKKLPQLNFSSIEGNPHNFVLTFCNEI